MKGKQQKNGGRTPDVPLFVSTDPQKLHAASFAGDPRIMEGIRGCRIPALLNAALPEGGSVLLAAADIGNEGADWGSLGLAVRRSFDGGKTWDKPRGILRLQAHHAPQAFDEWQSPFTIDPVLMQALDGRILLVADMWPESMGFGRPAWLENRTGYEEAGGKRFLALYDGPSRVGLEDGRKTPDAGRTYTVREQGWVYDDAGRRTRYYLPQNHEGRYAFITLGDLYYAVGEPDYLNSPPPPVPPPPDGKRDLYVGNVLMSEGKPPFDALHPAFVQKRRAGPGGDVPSDYPILETDPAPLRCAVTSFLWMLQSFDGGETWSPPADLSRFIKREEDGPFLGVGPGVGLCLKRQRDERRAGRLLLPLYNGTPEDLRASAAYSDDGGATWNRPAGDGRIHNRDEVQFAELTDGTILSFGRRGGGWQESGGPTPVSQSRDGGETWEACPETRLLCVRCQKSVISYPLDDGSGGAGPFAYPPGMTKGKQYLVASHPTGRSRMEGCPRTDGTLSLGEVQPDHSIRWIRRREAALPGQYDDADEEKWRRFFAYSCLAVLDDGRIGVAYEPQPNNYIAFFSFSLEWLLEGDGAENTSERRGRENAAADGADRSELSAEESGKRADF